MNKKSAAERDAAALMDAGANFSVSRREVLVRWLIDAFDAAEVTVPRDVIEIVAGYSYVWLLVTGARDGIRFWAPHVRTDADAATASAPSADAKSNSESVSGAQSAVRTFKLVRSWMIADLADEWLGFPLLACVFEPSHKGGRYMYVVLQLPLASYDSTHYATDVQLLRFPLSGPYSRYAETKKIPLQLCRMHPVPRWRPHSGAYNAYEDGIDFPSPFPILRLSDGTILYAARWHLHRFYPAPHEESQVYLPANVNVHSMHVADDGRILVTQRPQATASIKPNTNADRELEILSDPTLGAGAGTGTSAWRVTKLTPDVDKRTVGSQKHILLRIYEDDDRPPRETKMEWAGTDDTYRRNQHALTCTTVLPLSGRIVTGDAGGFIKIWSQKNDKNPLTIAAHVPGQVSALQATADHKLVSSCHLSRAIHVWSTSVTDSTNPAGTRLLTLACLPDWGMPTALLMLPDGRLLSACGMKHMILWSLTTGQALTVMTHGHAMGLHTLMIVDDMIQPTHTSGTSSLDVSTASK